MDYLYTHKDATVRFHASDMILNIHSDASYLSESRARSRIGGIYFMGQAPHDGRSIQLNGPIHIQASICKFVVASAAEAELGALFYNCQDGKIFRFWRNSDIHNLQHPCIATIAQRYPLQMTLLRNSDHAQWKCDSSG
jgi:hypothetical protein